MGYSIKLIEEIDTFDYSICSGFSNANTVRRSVNGQKFLVEGETITEYTHAEILLIMDTEEWTDTNFGI